MPKYQLHVISTGLNPITGHHSVNCRVVETRDDGTELEGVPETHGIEATALESSFGGDIQKWLDSVSAKMLARHKRRMLAKDEIIGWHGLRFDIPE